MGYERRKQVLHETIRGWVGYFKLADMKSALEAIDQWLRRRIRMCIWKAWKRPRTRVKNLIKCGIKPHRAYQWGNSSSGYWRVAGSAIMSRSATDMNLRKAGFIPACWTTMFKCTKCKEPPYAERHVRWCERSVNESRR